MSKKHMFLASAAMFGLIMASCSNDVPAPAAGGDGPVVFTAKMPGGVNSRSFADGTTAQTLRYAVYEAGTANVIYSSDQPDAPAATYNGDRTFSLSLNLVKGQSYDLAFWAQQEDAPYTFDPATQSVTVDYDGILVNDESRDAFFSIERDLTVTGAMQKNIDLYRPFAQLNIGTDDLDIAERAGITLGTTSVTVSEVYTSLNLMTGEAYAPETIMYGYGELPGEGETFPVTGYDYLSMNYILTGTQILDENVNSAQKETKDITIAIKDRAGKEVNSFNVSAVPFQRNYRTNIYGSLLTSTVDYIIEIKPGFNDPENNIDADEIIADGVIFNSESKTYTIMSADGLTWLNDQANSKKNQFTGYTIKLGADIDMAGLSWTPLNKGSYFNGTFDGCGYALSNMTASDPDCAGFVWSNRGHINNLTMKNVNVSGNFKVGAIAGDGLCGHFDNCIVDGGTITSTPRKNSSGKMDDGNNAGGITGYLSAEPNASLTNCTVKNVTVTAFRTLGAIAGTVGGGNAIVSGNTAIDCKVIANQLVDNYDALIILSQANDLFGRFVNSASKGENNAATNVVVEVVKANSSGVVAIKSAAGLEAINTSLANKSLAGKTITLANDIDATGVTMSSVWNSQAFRNGVIDGQGHTISNLNIVNGIIPAGPNGTVTVRNLTLKDCNATSSSNVGGCGMIVGQVYTNIVIENVNVEGGSVEGAFAVGALIGQLTSEEAVSSATIKNCSVKDVAITAYGNSKGNWIEVEGIGGANALLGCSISWWNKSAITVEGNTVEGCTFNNDPSVAGGGLYADAQMNMEIYPQKALESIEIVK